MIYRILSSNLTLAGMLGLAAIGLFLAHEPWAGAFVGGLAVVPVLVEVRRGLA